MAESMLGKLIDESAQRDAIHVAIVPLIAGQDLDVGKPIKLAWNSKEVAMQAGFKDKDAIGIVDPFLNLVGEDGFLNLVSKGQRFYGCLFPNTVTGMRHHWQHPIFTDEPAVVVNDALKADSERWIRNFASQWDIDFNELVSAAVGSGEWRYATAIGTDLHGASDLGADHDLFWYHLERMTGQKFDEAHRDGMGWSCSC